MKRFEKSEVLVDEKEVEDIEEEIDIILGEKYGAVNVVGSCIECSAPSYSEKGLTPVMIENEDETKLANGLFSLSAAEVTKQRIQH